MDRHAEFDARDGEHFSSNVNTFELDEQSSADEKGPDRVTVEVSNADLLVPSALHDSGDAHSIVAVVFVDLHLQG
jgi:hypothetical protein